MLVVHCASGDSLTEQLGALRCAVCIARALGAELMLPRWKCGPFWLASEQVIDVGPLAALVPVVGEQEAQARCRIAAADTVHCVRLGTSCEAAATADFEAYLAALGLATPALLASSPSAAAVDAPIRSSSEIRQLLGTTLGAHTRLADVRVLLLPSLAASLVS